MREMKAMGIVTISAELLAEVLKLPDGLEIVDIQSTSRDIFTCDAFYFKLRDVRPPLDRTLPEVREGEAIPHLDVCYMPDGTLAFTLRELT